MATINNSQLTREIIEGAKIETAFDSVPNQIAEKVVPVMEVNPKMMRRTTIVKENSLVNALAVTIYTTNSTQDFYLTSAQLAGYKDNTSTTTLIRIVATINGAATAICGCGSVTLNAHSIVAPNQIINPIKIDRGSSIQIVSATNVGNFSVDGIIMGYYDEVV